MSDQDQARARWLPFTRCIGSQPRLSTIAEPTLPPASGLVIQSSLFDRIDNAGPGSRYVHDVYAVTILSGSLLEILHKNGGAGADHLLRRHP